MFKKLIYKIIGYYVLKNLLYKNYKLSYFKKLII